jgi:hypothetical protein
MLRATNAKIRTIPMIIAAINVKIDPIGELKDLQVKIATQLNPEVTYRREVASAPFE